MRAAQIVIETTVLRDALHLPENSEIIFARMADGSFTQVVITVIHPDLPEIPQGTYQPVMASPLFTADHDNLTPAVKLADWGVKK